VRGFILLFLVREIFDLLADHSEPTDKSEKRKGTDGAQKGHSHSSSMSGGFHDGHPGLPVTV